MTAHSRITTTITNHSQPPSQPIASLLGTITKRRKEAKRDKMKIGVGDYVTVRVGEINEKIREGKSRMMRKELVGWM